MGAVFGAINAAVNGENVWAGIGIGAATGALSGLAVDLAIATGGLLAGIAIAAVGGGIASFGESALNDVVNNKDHKVDWGEAIDSGIFGAATNVLGFGMGLEDGVKTGAKTIKQAFQYAGKNFVSNTIANSRGKIPKLMSSRLSNLGKNSFKELTGTFLIDGSTDLFKHMVERSFGGL